MALDDKLSNNDKSIMSIKLVGWSKFFSNWSKPTPLAGRDGDCIHGGVHHGDVDQDPGPGLHATQGQLHEEPLELHGLLCCHIWVSSNRLKKIIKWRLEAAEKNGLGGEWSSTTQLMVSPIEPQWIIQLGNQIWNALEVCKLQNYRHQKRIVFDAQYFLHSSWEDKQIWSLWWRYRLQSPSCGGHSEFWQAKLKNSHRIIFSSYSQL